MLNGAKSRQFLDNLFKIGIIIKGVDGVLEIIGSGLLFLVKPATISRIVILFTQHELSHDPDDFIANYLVKFSQNLSIKTGHFGAFYLLAHGLIKVILVTALLHNKFWAYLPTIGFLVLFIGYQTFRFNLNRSPILALLIVYDLLVTWFVWKEYQLKN